MYKYNPITGKMDIACFLIEKTYDQLHTIIAASKLIPGTVYKITDRGDRGLFFEALSTNQLSISGKRIMLCPAWYGTGEHEENNWLGIWHDGLTPTANDLAIWGGLVWKNLTGAVGSVVSDNELDTTNWELVPKASFAANEYVEMLFDVDYDFENDWIDQQRDQKGNIFGIDYASNQNEFQFINNPVDLTDWNFASREDTCLFMNNKSCGIFNNPFAFYILKNNVYGSIYNNTCADIYCNEVVYGSIRDNSNGGEISNNKVDNGIQTNSNALDIYKNTCVIIDSNSNQGSITNNSNQGSINDNSNIGHIQFCTSDGDVSNHEAPEIDVTEKDFTQPLGYSEIATLISDNALVPGMYYNIEDRGDIGLIFEALSTNQLSMSGKRIMLCPAWYGTGEYEGNNWLGIWHDGLTPTANDLAIWGGLVWKNLTGAVGSVVSDNELDTTNWELVPKASFAANEYVEMLFDVDYDFVNDWICQQRDTKGNVIGLDYNSNSNNFGFTFNPVDLTDWNISTGHEEFSFSKNIASGIFNNPFSLYIDDNHILGLISNNSCHGDIYQNIAYEIINNSNNGNIWGNNVSYAINENSNNGEIILNRVRGFIQSNSNLGNIEYCDFDGNVVNHADPKIDVTIKDYDSAIGDIQTAIDLINGEEI